MEEPSQLSQELEIAENIDIITDNSEISDENVNVIENELVNSTSIAKDSSLAPVKTYPNLQEMQNSEKQTNIHPSNVISQIQQDSMQLLQNKEGKLVMQLYPQYLGEVKIEMKTNEVGQTNVVITAENQDTYGLLLSERVTLEKALYENLENKEPNSLNLSFNFKQSREEFTGQSPSFFEEREETPFLAKKEERLPPSMWSPQDGLNIYI